MSSAAARLIKGEETVDDSRDPEPQGGYDVQCWRTVDGIGHRFDEATYDGDNGNFAAWKAMCGAPIDSGVPDLDDPVDCMTCIVKEACHGTA